MHTMLIAVDIIKFGDPRRDDTLQSHLRSAMYGLVEEAFAMTHIAWHACTVEGRGDGLLIAAPEDADPDKFLDALGHHVAALLLRHNRHASEAVRLQLRMAVHRGDFRRDEQGITSTAVVHLFRLLEAPSVKKAILAAGKDLGVVVSDQVRAEAVQRGGLVNPAGYQAQRIICKETRARGWLWLPPM